MARKAWTPVEFASATYDDATSIRGTGHDAITLRKLDKLLYAQQIIGDGVATAYTATLGNGTIRKGSLTLTGPSISGVDDGVGAISGTGIVSGTIDYSTGALTITLSSALSGSVKVNYKTVKSALGGEFISGVVILPEWKADAITELFGFEVQELHAFEEYGTPNQAAITAINYQISTDGGSNYYWHNGTAWVMASSAVDCNSWNEIDENISTLPFTAAYGRKSIRIKVFLDPDDDGKYSPKLFQVSIYHELQYEPYNDFLRSFKRYVNSNLRVLQTEVRKVSGTQSVFQIAVHEEQTVSSDPSVTFSTPPSGIKAYNLTVDPGRTTPLGFTFDSVDTITLNDAIVGPANIELQYYSTVPAYIGRDDRTDISTSRAVIISADEEYVNILHRGRPNYTEIEPEFSQDRVRKRIPTQIHDIEVSVTLQSPSSIEISSMASSIRRMVETTKEFLSVATGHAYKIVDTHVVSSDTDRSSPIITKTFTVLLRGKVFYPDYITEYTVQQVNIPLSYVSRFGTPSKIKHSGTLEPVEHEFEQFSMVSLDSSDTDIVVVTTEVVAVSLTVAAPTIEIWDANGYRVGVFTDFSDAVAALDSDGGRIKLGAGTWIIDSENITQDNLEIEGVGAATIIKPATALDGAMTVTGNNVTLRNFKVLVDTFTNDQTVLNIIGDDALYENILVDVTVSTGVDSNPMKIFGIGDSTGAVDSFGATLRNIRIKSNKGIISFYLRNAEQVKFHHCRIGATSADTLDDGSPQLAYRVWDIRSSAYVNIARCFVIGLGTKANPVTNLIYADVSTHFNFENNYLHSIYSPHPIINRGCRWQIYTGNSIGDMTLVEKAIIEVHGSTGDTSGSTSIGVHITANQFHDNSFKINVDGASWTDSSNTVTLAGNFTGYNWNAGDVLIATSGTGTGTIVKTPITITSKTSNDAIVLARDLFSGSGNGSAVSASIRKPMCAQVYIGYAQDVLISGNNFGTSYSPAIMLSEQYAKRVKITDNVIESTTFAGWYGIIPESVGIGTAGPTYVHNATYINSSKTITKTGFFSGYSVAPGDKFTVWYGVSGGTMSYTTVGVASSTANTIVLDREICTGNATEIHGVLHANAPAVSHWDINDNIISGTTDNGSGSYALGVMDYAGLNSSGNFSFGTDGFKSKVVDGAAANTDIAVSGLQITDKLVSVVQLTGTQADLTSSTSIKSGQLIQVTSDTTGQKLLVLWSRNNAVMMG